MQLVGISQGIQGTLTAAAAFPGLSSAGPPVLGDVLNFAVSQGCPQQWAGPQRVYAALAVLKFASSTWRVSNPGIALAAGWLADRYRRDRILKVAGIIAAGMAASL